MVMLDEIFTTLGATFLITGAKLVRAFTSRLSGASSIVTLGGEFVFAQTRPDCANKTIERQRTMMPRRFFIFIPKVNLTLSNHSLTQFTSNLGMSKPAFAPTPALTLHGIIF